MHSHGLGEVHADMLERDREAAVAIEREVLAEAQLAVGVVVDLLDDVGVGARRLAVGRGGQRAGVLLQPVVRSEEHTSELQSLMRISYAVFCLKKKKIRKLNYPYPHT